MGKSAATFFATGDTEVTEVSRMDNGEIGSKQAETATDPVNQRIKKAPKNNCNYSPPVRPAKHAPACCRQGAGI